MIISLKKYKQHGYIKGIFLIIKKMFISLNYTSLDKREMKSSQSMLLKNYPQLKKDSDSQKSDCTSCRLCESLCPTKAIAIETSHQNNNLLEGPNPKSFWLNISVCNQCNLCIDLCPVDALGGSGEYDLSTNIENPINIL